MDLSAKGHHPSRHTGRTTIQLTLDSRARVRDNLRMRKIAAAALIATGALALAACSGPAPAPATEAPAAAASTPSETPRTPDPEAPADAVFSESDTTAHTMCGLWTTTLEDPAELRDVADDVNWYSGQTSNDFLNSNAGALNEWGAGDPGKTDVLCKWNGYTPQDGSPSDLLG